MDHYPDEDTFKWLISRLKSTNIRNQSDAAGKLLRMGREELSGEAAKALVVSIASEGAIPSIVKMFRSEEEEVQARAATLLAGIASKAGLYIDEIVQCGAVEELVVVLNCRSAATRNAALAAVANIACNPNGAERANEAGVVPVLLEQFVEWQGARQRSNQLQLLLGALSNLAFHKGCAVDIAFSGALWPLFLHAREQEPFQAPLLVLLGRLGFFEECHKRLLNAEVVDWVLEEAGLARNQQLVQQPYSPRIAKLRSLDSVTAEVPVAALEALATWSKSSGEHLRRYLVAHGALHLAVELLSMDEMKGEEGLLLRYTLPAAQLLVGLAPAAAQAVQLETDLRAELTLALFRGLGSGVSELQNASALALQNLVCACCSSDQPMALAEELQQGLLMPESRDMLMELLQSGNLLQQCAGLMALRALAKACSEMAAAFVMEPQVLAQVKDMVNHEDPCCRQMAVETMEAMAAGLKQGMAAAKDKRVKRGRSAAGRKACHIM